MASAPASGGCSPSRYVPEGCVTVQQLICFVSIMGLQLFFWAGAGLRVLHHLRHNGEHIRGHHRVCVPLLLLHRGAPEPLGPFSLGILIKKYSLEYNTCPVCLMLVFLKLYAMFAVQIKMKLMTHCIESLAPVPSAALLLDARVACCASPMLHLPQLHTLHCD